MEQHTLVATADKRQNRANSGEKSAEEHQKSLEIVFPHGLIGCPDWRHFYLAPNPFAYFGELISIDEPGITFLVADPAWLRVEYSFELDDDDVSELELSDTDETRVLTILTVHRNPPTVIANLAGPLVFNWQKRIGQQVILDHHSYPLRMPVLVGESAQAIFDAMIVKPNEDVGISHHAATSQARKGA